MKKIVVLTALIALSFSLFAQIPYNNTESVIMNDFNYWTELSELMPPENGFYSSNSNTRQTDKSEWYAFPLSLNFLLGGNLAQRIFTVFPDSFPVLVHTDGTSYSRWHSLGAAFDPADDLWAMNSMNMLKPRQGYTIDSIGFNYYYFKHNDNDIKDELLIQIAHTNKVVPLVYQTDPPEPVATIGFDTSNMSVTDFHHQIKYELDYKDTVDVPKGFYRFRWLALPVNINVPKSTATGRNIALATVTFKPKYSYNFGDTLHSYDTTVTPYNKLNSFFFRIFVDESAHKLSFYNN